MTGRRSVEGAIADFPTEEDREGMVATAAIHWDRVYGLGLDKVIRPAGCEPFGQEMLSGMNKLQGCLVASDSETDQEQEQDDLL